MTGVNMTRYPSLLMLCASLTSALPINTCAEPYIAYKYSAGRGVPEIVGVNGIVDLEPAMAQGCESRIADLEIDEVVYKPGSDIVTGFRARKPASGSAQSWFGLFAMRTDQLYANLSNAARQHPLMLIRRGAKVIVTYQVCGSGGYAYVRDIFSKGAVNNP